MATNQQKFTSSGNPYGAPKRERTRGEKVVRVLIVLVLLTLIGLFGFSQYREFTTLPEEALATVSAPAQNVFSRVVNWGINYLERLKLRSNIEYEYNKIKAQNDQLMYDSLLNESLKAENDRLTALLNAYDDYTEREMDPIAARVIDRDEGSWFSTFTINRGTNHGVEANMAVITVDGLVGRVSEVFPTTAKVVSIIDSNSSIAGVIESSRDQGMVKGSLALDGEALCRMYYLPINSVPRPGDVVSTSGMGIAFPRGLVIGTVRESTRAMEEGKYYIVVEPLADFQHIEEVLVLRYVAEEEQLPEGMYSEDQQELIGLPPAPVMPEIEQDAGSPTAAPIPGAPGRSAASPEQTPQAGEGANAEEGEDGPDPTPTPPPENLDIPLEEGGEGTDTLPDTPG